MICPAGTGERVGDGQALAYSPVPIPVSGLQFQVPLRAFGLPFRVATLTKSPKVGTRTPAHRGRLLGTRVSSRATAGGRAAQPSRPGTRRSWASLRAQRRGREPQSRLPGPRPPAPAPAPLPRPSPRPLPPVTCIRSPRRDPVRSQELSRTPPAVAGVSALPRPRLHRPLPSPRGAAPACAWVRGTWDARPHREVGKLPGVGVSGGASALPFAWPHAPHPPRDPDSPGPLASSSQQPTQKGAGRRLRSDHPPIKNKINKQTNKK